MKMVTYFQVEVDDTLRMHVTDSLTYLSHKQDAIAFRQREIVGHHAFK